MNLGEIISMLKLFPQNTPILNCPTQPHYQKKKGMAFVIGNTVFNQKPTNVLSEFLQKLEYLLSKEANEAYGESINENTCVYLVEGMHKPGVKVKGLLFTPEGVKFVPEEFNYML